MIIYNSKEKEVPILHFQSISRDLHSRYFLDALKNEVSIPSDITVITFCNKPLLDCAPLIKQLSENNIPFHNPAASLIEWQNTWKPKLLLEVIDKVQTQYVLVLDSLDVALTPRVNEIIERFHTYDKAVLFGATKNRCPNREIEIIKGRDKLGAFCYLNAGTCIGYTQNVKEFYRQAADIESKVYNPLNKEQLLIRLVFKDCQDTIGFDYNCECFQTFDKAIIKPVDDEQIKFIVN